jgi:hypothetical protein
MSKYLSTHEKKVFASKPYDMLEYLEGKVLTGIVVVQG